MQLRLAFRNLSRNRRRSIATVLTIMLGYAAVTLFGGYVANVYGSLSKQAIHGEKLGHLTIAKPGYFDLGNTTPENYIFDAEDQMKIKDALKDLPGLVAISPRLSASGLLSNGNTSTIFIGDAIAPKDLTILSQGLANNRAGVLSPNDETGIAVAKNLAKALSFSKGDEGVIFGSTFEGQANAMDFRVEDVYNTGNAATNDKAVVMPMSLAQQLLDTQGADRMTVLLDNKDLTQEAVIQASERLRSAGIKTEIRTWDEQSSFYRQVKNLFNMIFIFIFTIVLIIVVMSIINTMSMVVIERTREIGTLRAIGMQRNLLLRLFSFEGLLLAIMGCLLGLALTAVVATTLNAIGLTYTPPNSSSPVRLLIDLVPQILASVFVGLCLFAVMSSAIPARKAANAVITDSLGHV